MTRSCRSKGGRHPPQALDVYVSSNVCTSLKEPQYCIMYASGQQPGRAGGPGKSSGPPKAAPKVSAPLAGACLRGKTSAE